MKQIFPILMLVAAVSFVGCRQTTVAGVTSSDEESAWETTIRRSYPGYRPPRNSAPAEFDNTLTRRSAVMKKQAAQSRNSREAVPAPTNAPAAADDTDPMVVVDNAAEVTSTNPDAEPDAKAAAPAPAAAAEAPQAEVKAQAKPAEEKKAEAPQSAAPANKGAAVQSTGSDPLEPTASTVYVVKSGDTLGGIARRFYGNARYYEVITRANADLIKNPNALRPGMKLIIPKL